MEALAFQCGLQVRKRVVRDLLEADDVGAGALARDRGHALGERVLVLEPDVVRRHLELSFYNRGRPRRVVRGAFSARLGELLGHGPVLLVAQPSNRGEVGGARRRRPGLGVARLDVGAFEQVRGGEARGRDGRLHLLDRRLGRSSAARRRRRRRAGGVLFVAQPPDRREIIIGGPRVRYGASNAAAAASASLPCARSAARAASALAPVKSSSRATTALSSAGCGASGGESAVRSTISAIDEWNERASRQACPEEGLADLAPAIAAGCAFECVRDRCWPRQSVLVLSHCNA